MTSHLVWWYGDTLGYTVFKPESTIVAVTDDRILGRGMDLVGVVGHLAGWVGKYVCELLSCIMYPIYVSPLPHAHVCAFSIPKNK